MAQKSKIQKAERESLNIKDQLITALKTSAPEVFADGLVNFEKLKKALGAHVEQSPDKFNFSWAGKSAAIENVPVPSKATLRPDKKDSIKFDESENIFIEGDNLEVLKLLQRSYFEKVKMIYIDPPYNTGNDFVYRDDFCQPLKNYLEQTAQVDNAGNRLSTNSQTSGRFHSDWLTMMYPRLKLAWNLLRDDGVIFISIDDNEVHRLRMLMDEIFGEANFVGQLTVLSNPRGRSQDKYFATNHEYIIAYSKTILPKNSLAIEKDEGQVIAEYTETDDIGSFRLLELRNTHRDFGKHNRRNLYYPIYVDPQDGGISLESKAQSVAVLPDWDDGFEGCWTWQKDTVMKNLDLLEARMSKKGNWKIYRKSYASGADRMLKTVLNDKAFFTEKGQGVFNNLFESKEKIFQSPKSVELLAEIFSTRLANDDIVLDFFAGSGTTAHSVLAMNHDDGGNRKFILVQMPEPTDSKSEAYKAGFKTIAEIAKERIRRVIKGYADHKSIADGFKVFKLGASNYHDNLFEYDPARTPEENEKNFQAYLENVSKELFSAKVNEADFIYENIIKEGLNLNAVVSEIKLGKNKGYVVRDADREFTICLDAKIDKSAVDELTKSENKDRIFICFDSALSDSIKANLALNLSIKTI